jgi:hypothetical protein
MIDSWKVAVPTPKIDDLLAGGIDDDDFIVLGSTIGSAVGRLLTTLHLHYRCVLTQSRLIFICFRTIHKTKREKVDLGGD